MPRWVAAPRFDAYRPFVDRPHLKLPLVYPLASFVAAALLFGCEPWAAKLLLPSLGGSAAVWLTTMLFFQTAVVVGYGYAHFLAGPRPRPIHAAVLAVAAVLVPIGLHPVGGTHPVLSVLASLTLGVGVTVIAVSATTPTLHTWLTRQGYTEEPFVLYAASNAGSFAGLLAYPILVEPFVELGDQTLLWRGLFVLLAIGVAACAFWRAGPRPATSGEDDTDDVEDEPQRPQDRAPAGPGRWFVYSFIPASLLYGFTAFVTRDIAALPMVWVVPLALYLLTFVLAFGRRPFRMPAAFQWAGPVFLYFVALVTVVWTGSAATLVLHLVGFVAFALYFHGELSRARPEPERASEFYLWVSFGGVAAGVVNAVIAPLVLEAPLEYPLTYGIALVLIPATYVTQFSPNVRKGLHAAMMIVLGIAFAFAPGGLGPKLGAALLMGSAFFVTMAFPALSHVMLAVFLGAVVTFPGAGEVVEHRRSFYGTHTVERRIIGGKPYFALADGVTQHGIEPVDGAVEPIGYYTRSGPCGDVFAQVDAHPGPNEVAIVGLGIGMMALYGRPTDHYHYFEIDPVVADIAHERFTSLARTTAEVSIDIIDGRLGLQGLDDHSLDLIVIDAFSSDAIPIHLLTREAFAIYASKLAPDGLLFLHTSNRYLDIDRVAIGALSAANWAHRERRYDPGSDGPADAFASSWVVAAPPGGTLGGLGGLPTWQILRSDLVWTDDYSSLLGALR